jgi:hypothetical protein
LVRQLGVWPGFAPTFAEHEVRQKTQQAWADLAADDLATAYRVLSTITARINTMLAPE